METETIKSKLRANIDKILDFFEVRTYTSGDLLVSNCPVHEGDNQTAFNVNINKRSEYCGRWFCNTKGCHSEYGGDILGLIRGLIASKNNGISSFTDVLDLANKFCGSERVDITCDNFTNLLLASVETKKRGPTREQVRSKLSIPSRYYLERGFSEEVLNEFDVGDCFREGTQMFGRSVFPVYDPTDKFLVGSVGRAIEKKSPKWINEKGFDKANYLFNYGKAIVDVCKIGEAILVEGQGDVMRLWEAGIKNVFGIFGSNISLGQEILLQKTGVMSIVTAFDNDSAGEKARISVDKKLGKLFSIRHKVPKTDVGDMSVEDVKGLFNE